MSAKVDANGWIRIEDGSPEREVGSGVSANLLVAGYHGMAIGYYDPGAQKWYADGGIWDVRWWQPLPQHPNLSE